MKIALALFAICIAGIASAQTSTLNTTLNFKAPTTHTDGSAITGALTYNIYQGAKGATKPKVTTFTTTTGTVANVAPGACFQVTAVEAGVESALSQEACILAAPGVPTNVTVTVQITITP